MGVENIVNFQTASGTINTALGLGIQIGALGLALDFTNRALDRTMPKKQRKQSYLDYNYDYRPKKSRRKKQDIWAIDW